jgi:hypothetical protein
MNSRGLTSFEKLFLNSRECLLWPDCACFKNITHWQDALIDEDQTFTREQLEAAEEVIFYSCACVAAHCPDPEIKRFGARQWAELTLRRQRIAAAQREARAN